MSTKPKFNLNTPPKEGDAESPARSGDLPAWEEQRRYKRVNLEVSLRFMTCDKSEHQGTLLDISAGGLSIKSDVVPEIESSVIFYIENLGRFEGIVRRTFEGGFAVEFDTTSSKKEKTADTLTWLVNKELIPEDNARRYPRSLLMKKAVLQRENGDAIDCEIIDMSLGGVLLNIKDAPPIGEKITIGHMEGRVVRHTDNGVGIEFMNISLPKRNISDSLYDK